MILDLYEEMLADIMETEEISFILCQKPRYS